MLDKMCMNTPCRFDVSHRIVCSIEGLLEEVFMSFLKLRPLVASASDVRDTAQVRRLHHRAVARFGADVVLTVETAVCKAEDFGVEGYVVGDDLVARSDHVGEGRERSDDRNAVAFGFLGRDAVDLCCTFADLPSSRLDDALQRSKFTFVITDEHCCELDDEGLKYEVASVVREASGFCIEVETFHGGFSKSFRDKDVLAGSVAHDARDVSALSRSAAHACDADA